MIFFLLHVGLVILQSPTVADLLENHIDVATEGKKLRFKTMLGPQSPPPPPPPFLT